MEDKLIKSNYIPLKVNGISKSLSKRNKLIIFYFLFFIKKNIKKMDSSILNNLPLFNLERYTIAQLVTVIDHIVQYYVESETEFSSSDVQKYLFEILQ